MRHTGAPERNSKLQFCYHSRPQIFVLIPHARSAHHARSASNKMNDPETSSTRPRKTENWKETIAVESKTTATRPRTIRPLVSRLRVKYLFMMFERSFETTPVFFFFGTQRSFPDLLAEASPPGPAPMTIKDGFISKKNETVCSYFHPARVAILSLDDTVSAAKSKNSGSAHPTAT